MSEDKYVAYYQSLMNLEGLWEAIDQFTKYYYENCCCIAFVVEEQMKINLDQQNVGKTYTERSRELSQCIVPNKLYNDKEADNAAYKKQQNQLNCQKKKRERES